MSQLGRKMPSNSGGCWIQLMNGYRDSICLVLMSEYHTYQPFILKLTRKNHTEITHVTVAKSHLTWISMTANYYYYFFFFFYHLLMLFWLIWLNATAVNLAEPKTRLFPPSYSAIMESSGRPRNLSAISTTSQTSCIGVQINRNK